MQEVRAAVIGTGVMGRKYAQMIAEGKAGALRLTAVVCRSAGAQQWAKDTLADALQDAYLALLMERTLAAPGQPVESTPQPWNTEER